MGPYKLEPKVRGQVYVSELTGGGALNDLRNHQSAEQTNSSSIPSMNASAYAMVEREVGAWTDKYGLLFVDSPVGTGFSVAGTCAVSRSI